MATLQFVDSIASSPTLRLDINDGTNFNLFRDPDFSPPTLKRAVASTLITDGDYISATAYNNRVIRLRLRVHGTSKDNLATNLQSLGRELDRKNNVLKWQSTNATNPVFFRTFRSSFKLEVGLNESGDALNDVVVTLEILAESFAYGLRVTGSPITVNNDPAAGSNPCYFDVTGVTGDSLTPAFIQIDPPAVGGALKTILALRRHGTPGGVYAIQAEAMTQGTDTTVQVTDATMSGATNNYSRTTFATATMQTRLSLTGTFPNAASVEIRGRYKVYARLRRSDATSVINVRMFAGVVFTPSVTVPLSTLRQWLELGDVTIPSGFNDPTNEGYSNTAMVPNPISFWLQAERTSGAGTLDWDCVLVVPADESMTILSYTDITAVEEVIDGPNDTYYQRITATGALYGSLSASLQASGSLVIELAPNQTNRIAFLLSSAVHASVDDDKTWATSVTVSYWPRWKFIRP